MVPRTSHVLATVLVAAVAAVTGAPGSASADDTPRPVFHLVDPRINESSGLALAGGRLVTTNDSGSGPVLYVLDQWSGRTISTTTYDADVVDVEALAPAGGTAVWVGDIGDNLGRRDRIEVYRVPVVRGTRAVHALRYSLAYPDGPRDAETLLVSPRTGRLYVVSKALLGGTVYAAPRRLRTNRVNRLTPVGRVPGFLTDGTFLPDGRHVLLRGYSSAAVFTFPGLERVASVPLPAQPQGEAVALAPDGTAWITSEGVGSAVYRIEVPDPTGGTAPEASATPTRTPRPPAEAGAASDPGSFGTSRVWNVGVVTGALGLLAALGGLVLVRLRRRTGSG